VEVQRGRAPGLAASLRDAGAVLIFAAPHLWGAHIQRKENPMSERNGDILRAGNHAAYLRRLGYADAADALEAAGVLIPEPESDASRGGPGPGPQHRLSAAEIERQREGEAMMAALRRDCPDVFDR
jgi:hypothetical protein